VPPGPAARTSGALTIPSSIAADTSVARCSFIAATRPEEKGRRNLIPLRAARKRILRLLQVRQETGRDLAGGTGISMKNDWKRIFAFE
jgi:hypothetical protein